jgi:hypothetical protein
LDRYELWPHFKRHYEQQGVTQFICVSYGPQLPGTYTIQANVPVAKFTGNLDATLHNNVIQRVIEPNEWFLIADLDEFAILPGMTLAQATRQADADGANCIKGLFADRITADGSFPAQLENDIWQQFPLCTNATERICGGCPTKIVAIKGPTPVSGGHHILASAAPMPWVFNAWTHHFKWWGTNPGQFFWNRFEEPGYYRVELMRLRQHLEKHDGIDITFLKQLDTEQARICQNS